MVRVRSWSRRNRGDSTIGFKPLLTLPPGARAAVEEQGILSPGIAVDHQHRQRRSDFDHGVASVVGGHRVGLQAAVT